MNISSLRLLYDYNYWANGQILATAQNVTADQFLAPAEFPYGGWDVIQVNIVSWNFQ